MAFQRPFLISLKRGDSHVRWGFSIKGGSDYGEPLRIQMVSEDSLAEKCGLHEGDEVIQVGRVNVQDLSLGQAHELLARCGNKIEMFVVREDLFSPRKAKEPPVVKAVVHNPYNSPLSLYSTENIADTLAKQTEVLTEGHVSTEEEDGPENLSFKQKSAVFQLLEEQNKQEYPPQVLPQSVSSLTVRKPKTPPPPPPPKPKPPAESIYNGHDSTQQQFYQDQKRSSSRIEYQTTHNTVNQYQQEPTQYKQTTTVYQTQQGYQSPSSQNITSARFPTDNYEQQTSVYQSPKTNYQQSYQQQVSSNQYRQQQSYQTPVAAPQQSSTYQQSYQQQVTQNQYQQGYQSPVATSQHPGFQSPSNQVSNQFNYQQSREQEHQRLQQQTGSPVYQQLNQSNYQQSRDHQRQQQQASHQAQAQQRQQHQQVNNQAQGQQSQQQQQVTRQAQAQQIQQQQRSYQEQEPSSAVSKAEIRIGPAPPPRVSSQVKHPKTNSENMTAVYKNQYEQHLQKQEELQQRMLMNHAEEERRRANLVSGEIFEHNSTSGAPITYKAPPSAPPKPNWPPPPSAEPYRETTSPTGMMDISSVWPPKRSTAVDLPRTGFNPAAVREQGGNGRRCVWPPPCDDFRSSGGRTTPQSPLGGRKIQWNPSPSPPTTRRGVHISPSRRRDIQWPPPSPTQLTNGHGGFQSPRLSRKAQFDEHVTQHASINVPQTYRPPPGTQHVEFH